MRATLAFSLIMTGMVLSGPAGLRAQGPATVEMRDFAFAPHEWTVPAGASVKWVNFDDVPHHVVTEGSKVVDSGPIAPGADFVFTFTLTGRFTYRCAIHPTMLGVITVAEP
jgi:plastocyanin